MMPAFFCFKNAVRGGDRGFTLIEIVLTIVILGVLSLMFVSFFQAVIHSPDPMIRERAVALGQAMMDEILAKRWDEVSPVEGGPICTLESVNQAARPSIADDGLFATAADALGPEGENRADFDDVDDFKGLFAKDDNFTDQNGTSFSMAGYEMEVEICYIPSVSGFDQIDHDTPACATGTTDSKRIVVTVTSPLIIDKDGHHETFHFVAVVCNL